MLTTIEHLEKIPFPGIKRDELEVLQLNLGYKCNQQCLHCHVNAGPKRKESMTDEVMLAVKEFLSASGVKTMDLTGGAPEMHENFCQLVRWATTHDIHVIDRCNLTILLEDGYQYLTEFLAAHKVEVTASLPCYLEENINAQRGKGVYEKSIRALQLLNSFGYGQPDSPLLLNLVYNPQGASLPPAQENLQADYKKFLWDKHGIAFNNLMTITNLPIARFGSTLLSRGEFSNYMQLLQDSFQSENLANVMCRKLLSVSWDGKVYDCDFNQMLGLVANGQNGKELSIHDLNNNEKPGENISVSGHCYGCVCGQGSSCFGALAG